MRPKKDVRDAARNVSERILPVALLVLALTFLGLAWWAGVWRVRTRDAEMRVWLLRQAMQIARNVNPRLAEQLTFTADDHGGMAFQRLRGQLTAYAGALPCRGVYTLALRDGDLRFGPESYDESDLMASPPGTVYEQPAPEDFEVFTTGKPFTSGPTTDEYGTFVSALAPVFDSSGDRVLMVVGIDMKASEWNAAVNVARWAPLGMALLLMAGAMAGAVAIRYRAIARSRHRRVFRNLEPVIVAVLGALLVVALVAWVVEDEQRERSRLFENDAMARTVACRDALIDIRKDLDAIARFFEGSQYVDRDEFAAFAGPIAQAASVVTYKWAPYVLDSERERFEAGAIGEGFEGFSIWEYDADGRKVSATNRAVYFPVFHVEPAENEATRGFDVGTDPTRREALEASLRTGLETAAAPIDVVRGDGTDPGMLLCRPVFRTRGGATDALPADSRRTAMGFALAIFPVQTVLENALRSYDTGEPLVAVELVDLTDRNGPVRLAMYPADGDKDYRPYHARREGLASHWRDMKKTLPIFVFGRTLAIVAHPTPLFLEAYPVRSGWIAGSLGIFLTLILTMFVGILHRYEESLESEVGQRTAALAESERRISTLMANLPGMAYRCRADRDWTMEFVSKGCYELTGYLPTALLHNALVSFENLIHVEDRERVRAVVSSALDAGREFVLEYRIVNAAGMPRWVWEKGRGVQNEHGVIKAIEGLIIDVTDRKTAEEEHRKLDLQIQQTQKLESLGILAGGIAHDFNNILMVVLGHAELAMGDVSAGSPVHESLREIAVAAHRASDLCRQMLAYSGKASFCVEPVDMHALIEEMVNLLNVSISKKARLKLNLDRSLPPILADPGQIRQVVMNLIINASEAIGDGGGTIAISTGVSYCERDYLTGTELHNELQPGPYAFIEVADTGCGMDARTRACVFEPFFTTKFAGRGLGLAAVLGIVRSHRGAIKVYSEPGRGATFKVLLPVEMAAGVPSGEAAIDSTWRGHGTALLADDEESLRELGEKMLMRLGYTVVTASNGREAVDLYRQRNGEIDVAMLDLTMPIMDGLEAFSALRDLNPSLPILIASGYSQEDLAVRFAGKSISGIVQKPYSIDKLRSVLSKLDERSDGS